MVRALLLRYDWDHAAAACKDGRAGAIGTRPARGQRESGVRGRTASLCEPVGRHRPNQSRTRRQPRRSASLLRCLQQAMPTKTPPTASPLDAYLDLLQALAEHGIDYVVIGGCAVGAYANSAVLSWQLRRSSAPTSNELRERGARSSTEDYGQGVQAKDGHVEAFGGPCSEGLVRGVHGFAFDSGAQAPQRAPSEEWLRLSLRAEHVATGSRGLAMGKRSLAPAPSAPTAMSGRLKPTAPNPCWPCRPARS